MSESPSDPLMQAVYDAVSLKVIESLDGQKRDAILARAVSKCLTDAYEIKHAAKEVIVARAKQIVMQEVETGKYDEQLTAAIRAGFANFIAKLPKAVEMMLTVGVSGEKADSSSYSRDKCGLLLGMLDKVQVDSITPKT